MRIPIFPELREVIDASRRAICTPRPYLSWEATGIQATVSRQDGFGNFFLDAVRAAGLDGISPHGLRKAFVAQQAEQESSTSEIAANWWVGKCPSRCERYTKSVQIVRSWQKMLRVDVKTGRRNRNKIYKPFLNKVTNLRPFVHSLLLCYQNRRGGDPYGTRTRVFAVGRCPRPLDEGSPQWLVYYERLLGQAANRQNNERSILPVFDRSLFPHSPKCDFSRTYNTLIILIYFLN